MDYRLALLVSVFGLCSPSLYALRRFHYIDLNMTWHDAQRYCRETYSDLATIENMSDISRLNRPDVSNAWIGLHDDPKAWKTTMGNEANSWRWSSTGVTSSTGYYNWGTNEPNNNYGKEYCLYAYDAYTYDGICDEVLYFICYTASPPANQKTFFFIEIGMNWTDAQTYCRTHHTDLATFDTAEENSELKSVGGGNAMWIGLYREPWRWSDNKDSSFRNWKAKQPDNNNNEQYCVMSNEQHQWEDVGCEDELPFWCQGDPEQKVWMHLKIQTDADLSDPAINAQLLQQLEDLLGEATGHAHLKLKIQPGKQQQQEKKRVEDQCPLK